LAVEQERQRREALEKQRREEEQRLAQEARKKAKALEETARTANVLSAGKEVLAVAQMRNRLLRFPLVPAGLLCAVAVCFLALVCQARPLQAVILGGCFAAAAVFLAVLRRKIKRLDTTDLELCIKEAHQRLDG
jgi:Flp pilus assembly protein TadB